MDLNQIHDNWKQFTDRAFTLITRPGIKDLMEWLINTDFPKAPASTRFHGAEWGGLCAHSLNVHNNLVRFAEDYLNPADYKNLPESVAIVSLFHDLCKVNVYESFQRNVKSYDIDDIRAADDWQVKHDARGNFVWKTVDGFKYNDKFPYGHGEKSVLLIQRFMTLEDYEAMAIRYHMGATIETDSYNNSGKAFSLYPLAFWNHIADYKAGCLDESEPGD